MGCPSATAFYWAKDPKVRPEVDVCRRRALTKPLAGSTGMAVNAVDGITNLAKGADSESVQLRAWRAILAQLMSVAKFSVLEYRMTEIEEQLGKQNKDTRSEAARASCPRGRALPMRGNFPADGVSRVASPCPWYLAPRQACLASSCQASSSRAPKTGVWGRCPRKRCAIAWEEAAQWHPTSLGTTIERDSHKNPHETF